MRLHSVFLNPIVFGFQEVKSSVLVVKDSKNFVATAKKLSADYNPTANKAVEVNGRGGMCRIFHVVREFDLATTWRFPPVPHLLRSLENMPSSASSDEPTVLIHGSPWKTKDIADSVEWCLTQNWHRESWSPSAALVHKKGGAVSQYRGQKFDPDKIDLVEDGWSHDHCEICWWTLRESDDPDVGVGYRNETNGWICSECFEQFVGSQPSGEKPKANKACEATGDNVSS